MRDSIRAAFVLAIIVGAASPAFGQYRGGGARQTPSKVPRYTPSSPTVSPFVNLNRNGGNAATNYYGLIRPLERQASINAAQSQAVQGQQQQIQSVQQQQESFEQPDVKPTGTAGWFQNTGKRSTYQTSGHYYGQWQAGKSQRRNAGR